MIFLQKRFFVLLGISIGGGAPLCPCLYIVQVRRRKTEAKAKMVASVGGGGENLFNSCRAIDVSPGTSLNNRMSCTRKI